MRLMRKERFSRHQQRHQWRLFLLSLDDGTGCGVEDCYGTRWSDGRVGNDEWVGLVCGGWGQEEVRQQP